MKKLALTSLPIFISSILSGCGGEELFNEPAADLQSCIVGNWTNEGKLPDYHYAENYTFFADGTMQRDIRMEVPSWLRFAAWISSEVNSDDIERYGILFQTGAWKYEDGIFYMATQHSQLGTADTEADALAMAIALTAPAVPMESSPSWTEYYGATTHCDEEFLKRGVYKKDGESPLIYKNFYTSSSPDAVSPYISEGSYTLYPDGTGIHNGGPIVYSYEGNVMNVTVPDCESCSTSQFIDHGHSLIRTGGAYFVRQ